MNDGLDPELLRLLAEILGDDDATLTRISRMRPSLLFDEPLSAGTPFLTKPERHLLRWRREEVAQLLYEGCMVRLLAHPEQTRTISPEPVNDPNAWVRRCQRALKSNAQGWPEERDELSTASPAGLGLRAARLAFALHPTDDTRFVLGAMLQATCAYSEAREFSGNHARSTRVSGMRSSALTILAACAWNDGLESAAAESYRLAALESNPSAVAPVMWFLHDLRANSGGQVSAELLKCMSRGIEGVVAVIGPCARAAVSSGMFESSDSLLSKMQSVSQGCRPLIQEVIDAFA